MASGLEPQIQEMGQETLSQDADSGRSMRLRDPCPSHISPRALATSHVAFQNENLLISPYAGTL